MAMASPNYVQALHGHSPHVTEPENIMNSNLIRRASLCGCAALLMILHAIATPADNILTMVKDLSLPGRPTRWDYMAMDPVQHRLVIAHLGDSSVVIVSTLTGKVIGTVGDISNVHGVLSVLETNRIYATATGTNELAVIDSTTLKVISRVPTGRYPDGLAYAPEVKKIYVSDAHGNSETVIDARTHQRFATIPLGGSVGNTQYDEITHHIFVNVQGRRELVEINPETDRIVQRVALPDADGNHGLLIDAQRRLAFIACEGNDQLLVLDLKTRTVNARFRVPGSPDVLAFDKKASVLYVASESGAIYLFKVGDNGVNPAGQIVIGMNAHTVAVDPETQWLYLPLISPDGKNILRVMRPIF